MKAAQEFLKSLREHFANDSDAHGAAMEAEEPDSPRHAFHKSRQAACAKMVDKCDEFAGAFGELTHKADGFDGDLDAVVPTGISAVAPDAPGRGRVIPRYGQRQIPTGSADDSDLVAKVFGATTDDE